MTRRSEDDFAAEVEAHIQLEEDRLRAEGLSPEDARAAALRTFGNRTLRQEQFHDAGRSHWWDHLQRDVRLALRSLGRERSFTTFAVLLIGLGAGLTTAMFALYNGVVLRKISVPDPDSLINIVAVKDSDTSPLRYSMFERLRFAFDAADAIFGANGTLVPVTFGSQTEILSTRYAAGDVTRTLGIRPVLGRALTPGDQGPVAIISDRYWRRIGSDPAIVGKVLRAGPFALTIVGVVPADSLEMIRFYKSDLMVPFQVGLALESVSREKAGDYYVEVTARLKPGVTLEQAQSRLNALWPHLLAETAPSSQPIREWTRLAGGQGRVLSGSRGWIYSDGTLPRVALTLLLLAALVSLTMCTNLAGLLLSRGLTRQKEYGVRLALGAKRWSLVRYALVEVMLLSCAGGAAAILLAHWIAVLSLNALSFGGSIQADYGVVIDSRVILFGLFVSVSAAIAAQLVPAVRLSAVRVADSIKPGTHTISSSLGGRKAVLVVQVAASVVLVGGSLLFVRTLQSLAQVETGFHSRNVLAVRIAPRVPWSEAGPDFFLELLRRVRETPGVTAAGLTNRVPMESEGEYTTPLAPASGGAALTTDRSCVWPGFFHALRSPFLAGRDFRPSDTNALIVTRSLAQTLFPQGDIIGQYVRLGAAPRAELYQVVGVVGDVRFRSPRQSNTRLAVVPCQYVWKPPQTRYAMGMVILVDRPVTDVENAVREHIEAMGKQAVSQVTPLDRLIAKSMRNEDTLSKIATGFGAFTLLLTCAGVYAFIDLTVQSRRKEFGIRMALGAGNHSLLALTLRGLAQVLLTGAAAGLAVTCFVSRAYRTYLYGVSGFEPWLLAGAIGLVAAVALLSAMLPAWRAARIQPAAILRMDV